MEILKIKEILFNTGFFINNKFLIEYCNLILNNMNTLKNANDEYTECHHAIPKCINKYINIDVDRFLVNLKYSDHIKAHFYLACCCNDLNKDLFIDLLAPIREFSFVGTKYINSSKKNLISKSELLKINEFIKTNFEEIQKIKQNQQFLINEKKYLSALNFYDDSNKILWATLNTNKIKKWKYYYVCKSYNFVNVLSDIKFFKIKRFYNICIYYNNHNKTLEDVARDLKISIGQAKWNYGLAWKKYRLPRIFNNPCCYPISKIIKGTEHKADFCSWMENIIKLNSNPKTIETLFFKKYNHGIKYHTITKHYKLCCKELNLKYLTYKSFGFSLKKQEISKKISKIRTNQKLHKTKQGIANQAAANLKLRKIKNIDQREIASQIRQLLSVGFSQKKLAAVLNLKYNLNSPASTYLTFYKWALKNLDF